MFWWLWSTRRKVTVLAALLALPLAFLVVRAFGTGSGGEPGVASPSSVSSSSTVAASGSSTTTPEQDEVVPVAATPLRLRSSADVQPPAKLTTYAWLGTGAVPPPDGIALVLPGGEGGLSFWGLHRGVESFGDLVDSYATRYQEKLKVERDPASGNLERFRLSGSIEGAPFTATVRFLDLGGGNVSVSGVARLTQG